MKNLLYIWLFVKPFYVKGTVSREAKKVRNHIFSFCPHAITRRLTCADKLYCHKEEKILHNLFKTFMFNLFCADDNINDISLLCLLLSLLTVVLSEPDQIQAKEQVNRRIEFRKYLGEWHHLSDLTSSSPCHFLSHLFHRSSPTFPFDLLLSDPSGTTCNVMKGEWLKLPLLYLNMF